MTNECEEIRLRNAALRDDDDDAVLAAGHVGKFDLRDKSDL